ncbi:MAG: hypothetical protein IAG13_15555 [Deltaproteobacteria bacterium]|nr:hypothetical protein [Nannocystaceae bacterium]
MARDLRLSCRCGKLGGVATGVSPSNSNHVVCYCRDCQAFARWLGVDGIVDAHGGTEIVQIAPAQVRWNEGTEQLRCMRLAEGGLLRWYSDCCRTPVGNMVSAKIPFVGLPRTVFAVLPDAAVGPPLGVQARFAQGETPPGAHRYAPLGMIVGTVWKLSRWWLTGKGRPSAYFDDATGVPRVQPRVLTTSEREPLRPS